MSCARLLRRTALCLAATAPATANSLVFGPLMESYDEIIRPSEALWLPNATLGAAGAPRDHVSVQIAVESIRSIDQIKKTFVVQGYFRGFWRDHRLAYGLSVAKNQFVFRSTTIATHKVWTPGYYIQHTSTIELGDDSCPDCESLFVGRDGDVFWSRRMLAELSCNTFDVGRLPFDTQYCVISIGLYRYADEEVDLTWANTSDRHGALDLRPSGKDELEATEWTARVVEQRESMMLYDPSGTYKFAQVCIEMRRDSQRFFCVILFSILLLVATYSGLWVSPTAAPARVTLAFLCFLMVLNNSTCHASRACFASHLHAVRDFDASSRWMCAVYDTLRVLPPLLLSSRVWLVDFLVGTTCFNFVLLLEYSAVNYSATLRERARELKAKMASEKERQRASKRSDSAQHDVPPISTDAGRDTGGAALQAASCVSATVDVLPEALAAPASAADEGDVDVVLAKDTANASPGGLRRIQVDSSASAHGPAVPRLPSGCSQRSVSRSSISSQGRRRPSLVSVSSVHQLSESAVHHLTCSERVGSMKDQLRERRSRLDLTCRWFFPLAYAFFVLVMFANKHEYSATHGCDYGTAQLNSTVYWSHGEVLQASPPPSSP